MSSLLRAILVTVVVMSGFIIAIDDAEARRKFRFGGGSSTSRNYDNNASRVDAHSTATRRSTRVIVVPTGYHGGTSTKRNNNNIELVYAMPNTSDYAYGGGYFDVGFRHIDAESGEYVIYEGVHYMALKPKLQAQIAARLGFDPVEQHKKARAQRLVDDGASSVSSAAAKTAQQNFFGQGGAYVMALLLFVIGGVIIYAYRRRVMGALEVDGHANLEERMNARLKSMRE